MNYELHLYDDEFIIFEEGNGKFSDGEMNYIIQYVPNLNGGYPEGLILKEKEIKEFEIHISIDVFVNDKLDNEIAALATGINTLAQVAIVNGTLELNVKPFNTDNIVKSHEFDNFSFIPDDQLLKEVKKLLSKANLNTNSFKQFMLHDALYFEELDD